MVRPIDIHDQLTKTPLIERVQQMERAAEEGQQKYSQIYNEQFSQKQLQTAQSVDGDEKIKDTYEKQEKQAKQQGKQKSRSKRDSRTDSPDEDEKEMTLLGLEIDLLV